MITLKGHTEAISTCAWSPNGNTVATGSKDGTMRLWDTRTWVRRLAYYHLGDNVGIACLTFSPDGRWLACGPNSRECEILNVDFLLGYRSLWSPPRGQDNPHGTQRPYAAPSVAVFNPASTRFAAASSGPHDGITVTDVETGEEMLCLECRGLESIHDISFSPDGKVVLGALKTVGMEIISTWDASTGVQLLTLKEHTDMVRQARFSPCGKYIVSASDDGTVRLWRTSNGSCIATFSEHKDYVAHVAFSPDGKTLSSGGCDGSVVIRQMHDFIAMDGGKLRAQPTAVHHAESGILPGSNNHTQPSLDEVVDQEEISAASIQRVEEGALGPSGVIPSQDEEVESTKSDHSMATSRPARWDVRSSSSQDVLGHIEDSATTTSDAEAETGVDVQPKSGVTISGKESEEEPTTTAAPPLDLNADDDNEGAAMSGHVSAPDFAPTAATDPQTRAAFLPHAAPTKHEASIRGQWHSGEAEEMDGTATTATVNAKVDGKPQLIEENMEGPAGALAVAGPPLGTAGEANVKAKTSNSEGAHGSVRDRCDRAEISNGGEKQNRYVEGMLICKNRGWPC